MPDASQPATTGATAATGQSGAQRDPTPEEVQAIVDAALGMTPLPKSPEEEYNAMMQQIEPELTTASLGTLADKYANETPEEKASRAARYTQAFAKLDEQLGPKSVEWRQQMSTYHKAAFASLEQKQRVAEQDAIKQLEASMDAAA